MASSSPSAGVRAIPLRALLGLLTAALLLLCVEGALWLLDLPAPGLYNGDPRTVWWLRPGLDHVQPFPPADRGVFRLQTNALGLRGAPPPDAGPWTLALGCSTTFGWGVEADQAWPALLSEHIGESVVNGGEPGWSTHQARLGLDRLLRDTPPPTRVLLGYIVRDAQGALRPDADSTPTPRWQRARLTRLLTARLRPPSADAAAPPAGAAWPTARVPPAAYRENLQAILARLPPSAEVWLLAFPQPDAASLAPWRAVLDTLGPPVLAPTLPPEDFFAADPIHLTPEGNAALSTWLAEALRASAR